MRGMTYEQVRQQRVAEAKAAGDRYRTLAADTERETNDNWWVIDSPEVAKAVRQASAKMLAVFGDDFMELEDIESEAWIAAAKIADRAALCIAEVDGLTMGTYQHELEMDLLNVLGPIFGRHNKTVSGLDLANPPSSDLRLFDQVGVLRGGSDVEWAEDMAAVL